jgi:predicted ATP-dependent endonuclease of OLD family
MILKTILLKNYKSVESLEIQIEEIEKSYTYSLLGINESGKSSILRGISFFEENTVNFPSDFHNIDKPIEIIFKYELENIDTKELKDDLVKKYSFDKELIQKISLTEIELFAQYSNSHPAKFVRFEVLNFKETIFSEYTYNKLENKPIKKTKTDEPDFDLNAFFEENLNKYFYSKSHYIVFWQSTPEFLMLDDIDLTTFASDPTKFSMPLRNCFLLAGISNDKIANEINKLSNSVAINSLQAKLSDFTTKHINELWPEHPITITFQISNKKISLLIEDNGIKYSPKTASQRSDGFKQFLSFLLTISVENKGSELENTILLIDEPETHLHPPAQINLMNELINISSNNKKNIVFYATHSNYMIDKRFLNRNYKVVKEKNKNTKIQKILRKTTTYAEVNYDIFGILTNDYHNELYGFIEAEDKTKFDALKKDKKWYNTKIKKEIDVSLSEYIRHSIHHPENTKNKKFTDSELAKSIETLIGIRESLK